MNKKRQFACRQIIQKYYDKDLFMEKAIGSVQKNTSIEQGYIPSEELLLLGDELKFTNDGEQLSIHVANDFASRKRAYGLLYEIYREIGYGESNPSKLWYSLHEITPYSTTIMLMSNNNVSAALTIVLDSEFKIPADDVFKPTLDKMRNNGCKVVEVFSFGIRKRLRNNDNVKGKLVNIIYLISRYILKATHWVITVVPSHSRYYCDKMLFDKIPGKGFHKKTGVSCNMLQLQLDKFDSIPDQLKNRTLAKYFVPKEREEGIINHLNDSMKWITSEEINYFCKLRPDIQRQFLKLSS
jgi:hypothetical protein